MKTQFHPHDCRDASGLASPCSRGFRGPFAFTLIEIVVCMAIFAIGFAAIAMMLPAGVVMQRDIEARGFGDIIGRNALEVVKGKGVQSLTFDTLGSTFPMATALDHGVNVSGILATPGHGLAAIPWDMEQYQQCDYSNSFYLDGYSQTAGPDLMYQYFDTDHNGAWYENTGTGGGARFKTFNTANPDLTNCALGRIHALSNRPKPGFNLGMFSMLDFSYPSTIFNVSQRSYFAHVMRTNASTTPFGTSSSGDPNFWANYYSIPSTHNWQLTVVTTRANSGDEWPEQAEQNYTAPLESAQYAPGMSSANNAAATALHSSTPVYFRSKGGDSLLAGLPDSAACNHWPYWGTGAGGGLANTPAQYDPTVTAYGGNPTNANSLIRGWCLGDVGSLGGISTSWINANNAGWNFFTTYITPPIVDTATVMSGRTTYKYLYPVPSLLPLYAIVYDRDKDLLLVRYPQVFASNPIAGNTRLKNFWKDMNADHTGTVPAPYVDRRLKVGDSFLAAAWTTPFKVKELLDPATEYANLPAGVAKDAADPWNDGTYQIIRVTPSLSTTTYTANKPTAYRGPNTWTDPAPRMILVSPAPLGGGPSPWVSTLQLGNCNGTVFRDWDNLTD